MITSDVRDLICPGRPEWARLMPARLLGRHVEAIVTHVADEHARRRACGLGALEDSPCCASCSIFPWASRCLHPA